MFPYFTIFGKTIGLYAICAVVGLFVCAFVAYRLLRKNKVEYEDLILVIIAIFIGLMVGGHLLFAITNLDKAQYYFNALGFWQGLVTLFGGSVFYGGFLGGCLGLFVYGKIDKKLDSKLFFDTYAVFTPLFHAFGRVGCFFSGCCYGVESSWGFIAHGNTLVPEINDVRRLPIPLIEAALNLCIFALVIVLFKKEKLRGHLIYVYMLVYPVVRFIDEFYRGDAIRGVWFGLSTSQWISIVLFVVAVVHFIIYITKNKKSA